MRFDRVIHLQLGIKPLSDIVSLNRLNNCKPSLCILHEMDSEDDLYIQRVKTHAVFLSPEPNIAVFTLSTKSHFPPSAQPSSLSFPKTAGKIVSE